ncbi:hypothetical protein [Bacteroides gallinaceum]|nr:hypothetical protein [Bacteroides gallinaceum]
MEDNKKRKPKDHTKSGLSKIAGATIAIVGIILGIKKSQKS